MVINMVKKKKQVKIEENTRPPIVVVMGHIDHGKTTLLDHIRKTKVTESEAGGITQHAAAYEIENKGKKITFIDTPGHEAFTNIRKRGAKIADIAILVISADDKVNEQTIESLEAIKETKMPFVVAINKIDKENANPEKIKKELSEHEVYLEKMGGKVPCVEISAKTGKGIDELLEMIDLVAELEELKIDPNKNATGFVLESHVDPKRGTAATLIIQNGTLKQGMFVVSENSIAPVRIFENFLGNTIKEAGASSPVTIVGFNSSPSAGSEFQSFDNKKDAEHMSRTVLDMTTKDGPLLEKEAEAGVVIPIIVKADVAGSVEAFEKQIRKIETEKVRFNILRADVGNVNEDDVKLASSGGGALVVGFNINCPANIKILSERMEVTVKLFNIIYEAEDWLTDEVNKRTPIEKVEEVFGKVIVLKIFRDNKNKKIVGGEVKEGKILNGKNVKIYRRDFLLGEGQITELQKLKVKTEEAKEGEQFGALIQTKVSIEPKDTLEVYEVVAK
ncbi:translation initiation factor IF-2 [Patescibacteria group bacterium]